MYLSGILGLETTGGESAPMKRRLPSRHLGAFIEDSHLTSPASLRVQSRHNTLYCLDLGVKNVFFSDTPVTPAPLHDFYDLSLERAEVDLAPVDAQAMCLLIERSARKPIMLGDPWDVPQ